MKIMRHILFKSITRSTVKSLLASISSPNKHRVRLINSVTMRKVLINKSNIPIEIPQNKSGKNDYIKTILQSTSGRMISVEVSPNSDFQANLFDRIRPRFVAVTWLGNAHLELPTQEIPAIILAKKLCERDFSVLLHLAGRYVGKERMVDILNYAKDIGVKNILAVQGDRTPGLHHDNAKCDFPYASDLVLFIKETFGDAFCVGVAGYPNVHPESQTVDLDMKYLKLKVSNGADFIMTQAAFEYEALEKFATNCRQHNITVPILPGIFIIKSYRALINMSKYCGFKVSQNGLEFVEKNRENGELIENYGLDLAADLIKKSLNNKKLFGGAHIFSMNDLNQVEKVLARM